MAGDRLFGHQGLPENNWLTDRWQYIHVVYRHKEKIKRNLLSWINTGGRSIWVKSEKPNIFKN
jgi:hypothetical protein